MPVLPSSRNRLSYFRSAFWFLSFRSALLFVIPQRSGNLFCSATNPGAPSFPVSSKGWVIVCGSKRPPHPPPTPSSRPKAAHLAAPVERPRIVSVVARLTPSSWAQRVACVPFLVCHSRRESASVLQPATNPGAPSFRSHRKGGLSFAAANDRLTDPSATRFGLSFRSAFLFVIPQRSGGICFCSGHESARPILSVSSKGWVIRFAEANDRFTIPRLRHL